MANFTWSSSLSVNVPEIDKQHQQLFKALADLQEAMKAGKGKEEVVKVLNFLSDYVDKHFSDEEILMKKNNYPDFEKHKQIHEKFKAFVKEQKQKLSAQGADLSLVIQIQQQVGDWLVAHIAGEDKKYAPYIKQQ